MKTPRHIILSLVLAALVLPGVASRAEPAGAAEDRRLALDYTVYIGGFRVVDIALKAELADRAYRINMDLKAQGLLNMILDWSMSANSSGKMVGRKIVPVKAGHDSRWRGKQRRIRLRYSKGVAPTVVSVPPATSDDRRVVRPEDRLGARDLAGGILATLLAVGGADSCSHTEPVFDGRRRFDIVFDEVARDRLKPSDYSPFGGMALRCTLTIKRIAGFRLRQSRYRWMSGGKATVWIGRVFAGAPPVMVRMEMETAFGPLRAHLSGAARHPGNEILRLPTKH
jgi:hypothetical protein